MPFTADNNQTTTNNNQLSINTELTAVATSDDAVNLIDNTTKKIKVIAIGGGGRAIADSIKTAVSINTYITPEIEWIHCDTSWADIDSNTNDFQVIMIGDGTGSGGIMKTNAAKLKAQEQELKDIFNELNTLYILVAGASGGSSIILQKLSQLASKFASIVVLSGTMNKTNKAAENTLKNMKALNHVSGRGSVHLAYFDNGSRSYEVVNQEINIRVSAIMLFWSDTVSLDQKDMKFFLLDETLAKHHKYKLMELSIGVNTMNIETDTVNVRELIVDGKRDGVINDIEGEDGKQGMSKNVIKPYESKGIHKIVLYSRQNQFTDRIQKLDDAIIMRKKAEEEAERAQQELDYTSQADDDGFFC